MKLTNTVDYRVTRKGDVVLTEGKNKIRLQGHWIGKVLATVQSKALERGILRGTQRGE